MRIKRYMLVLALVALFCFAGAVLIQILVEGGTL